MNKIAIIVMYVLWILAILFVLAATFTNFEHLDLNVLALTFLVFAVANSFFSVSRKTKSQGK